MVRQMSEARLNDVVFILLKYGFFQPMFGENAAPRECDIRICMDLSCPERITSIASAILLPDEVAPKSHTTMYDVDTDRVFDETVSYMEDHWLKMSAAEASGNPNIRDDMRKWFDDILPSLMEVPEDLCAVVRGEPPTELDRN